jgi:hypothetical protein
VVIRSRVQMSELQGAQASSRQLAPTSPPSLNNQPRLSLTHLANTSQPTGGSYCTLPREYPAGLLSQLFDRPPAITHSVIDNVQLNLRHQTPSVSINLITANSITTRSATSAAPTYPASRFRPFAGQPSAGWPFSERSARAHHPRPGAQADPDARRLVSEIGGGYKRQFV